MGNGLRPVAWSWTAEMAVKAEWPRVRAHSPSKTWD